MFFELGLHLVAPCRSGMCLKMMCLTSWFVISFTYVHSTQCTHLCLHPFKLSSWLWAKDVNKWSYRFLYTLSSSMYVVSFESPFSPLSNGIWYMEHWLVGTVFLQLCDRHLFPARLNWNLETNGSYIRWQYKLRTFKMSSNVSIWEDAVRPSTVTKDVAFALHQHCKNGPKMAHFQMWTVPSKLCAQVAFFTNT